MIKTLILKGVRNVNVYKLDGGGGGGGGETTTSMHTQTQPLVMAKRMKNRPQLQGVWMSVCVCVCLGEVPVNDDVMGLLYWVMVMRQTAEDNAVRYSSMIALNL